MCDIRSETNLFFYYLIKTTMVDTKKTVWLFDLRENTMTKEVTNDYTANVRKLKSKTVSDIAAEIVSERTEYRPETIENIVRLYLRTR